MITPPLTFQDVTCESHSRWAPLSNAFKVNSWAIAVLAFNFWGRYEASRRSSEEMRKSMREETCQVLLVLSKLCTSMFPIHRRTQCLKIGLIMHLQVLRRRSMIHLLTRLCTFCSSLLLRNHTATKIKTVTTETFFKDEPQDRENPAVCSRQWQYLCNFQMMWS